MADVLSQNEIDALLKQLNSGELDVDEVILLDLLSSQRNI